MHRLKLLFLMRWNQILWIVCLKSIFILLSISETTIIVFYSCWVISRAISFYRCVNSTNTTWYPKYCWAIDLQFSRFGSYWTILDTTSCLYVLMWLIFKIMFQADLLLSYGYENDIKALTPHVPRSCQCLLMSATSRCVISGVYFHLWYFHVFCHSQILRNIYYVNFDVFKWDIK